MSFYVVAQEKLNGEIVTIEEQLTEQEAVEAVVILNAELFSESEENPIVRVWKTKLPDHLVVH